MPLSIDFTNVTNLTLQREKVLWDNADFHLLHYNADLCHFPPFQVRVICILQYSFA